jgi:4-amino-4-deoxy-L-arabinose transferase-like glycosyltransferase
LAGGYFDHPPMIAWLMKASCSFIGNNEFGVRFFAILMPFGVLAILVWLATRLFPEDGAARWWTGAILLASPLFHTLGTVFTPDTPAIFFSTCALACALLVVLRDQRGGIEGPAEAPSGAHAPLSWLPPLLWLLFGAFCGLAFLSKYTTILLPASIFLALLTSRRGHIHLRRPWIYLGGLICLAVFSSNILWNIHHDWASFRWQLGHGLAEAAKPQSLLHRLGTTGANLGEFVGGQLLVWTPVLFVLGVVILYHFWRRYRQLNLAMRLLLWSATFPLVFFGYAASRTHGEVNWPDFAYFPLTLLTVAWAREQWSQRRGLLRLGAIVALVGTVAIHFPEVLARMNVPKMDEVFGWRELGKQLDLKTFGAPLVTTRHQDAGEAAFYMSGQPDIWCVTLGDSRPTSFDFYPNPPDFHEMPAVWLMGSPKKAQMFADQYGMHIERIENLTIFKPGKPRTRRIILLTQGPPLPTATMPATTLPVPATAPSTSSPGGPGLP